MQARHVITDYLCTGEPFRITRTLDGAGAPDPVVRWMRYDSLGRMVLNVEPNTTDDFDPDPYTATPPTAWRYAYDYAGDLVGTSDARGCGIDFGYDAAGRLLTEDYHRCEDHHPEYDEEPEVWYVYDTLPAGGVEWDNPPPEWTNNGFETGRLVATFDRASASFSRYDGRGRVIRVATRIAKPDAHLNAQNLINGFEGRYAQQYFERGFTFDAADREVTADTGASSGLLMAQDGNGDDVSRVHTTYTGRGTVKSVSSSYGGDLVTSIHRSADGLLGKVVYGDLAGTATENRYDERRRLRNVITYRGPPDQWGTAPAGYFPAPQPEASDPTSFQLLLQDEDFAYDVVGNPIEITDWRIPEEWPAGAKPVTKKIEYDDLYRAKKIAYEYAEGDDDWVSPFQRELAEAANPEGDDYQKDPRRAQPSPHVSFDEPRQESDVRLRLAGQHQQDHRRRAGVLRSVAGRRRERHRWRQAVSAAERRD